MSRLVILWLAKTRLFVWRCLYLGRKYHNRAKRYLYMLMIRRFTRFYDEKVRKIAVTLDPDAQVCHRLVVPLAKPLPGTDGVFLYEILLAVLVIFERM